jgi:hypothetical protein
MSSSLACNQNVQCRTFDYDSSTRVCRLFEGALETGYSVSANSTSRIGFLKYNPTLFTAFQQPCSQCVENRYLTCSNQTCQCPVHSFWNGNQCENQRYKNASCSSSEQCRSDPFGLICSMYNICTSKSFASLITRTLQHLRDIPKFLQGCSASTQGKGRDKTKVSCLREGSFVQCPPLITFKITLDVSKYLSNIMMVDFLVDFTPLSDHV